MRHFQTRSRLTEVLAEKEHRIGFRFGNSSVVVFQVVRSTNPLHASLKGGSDNRALPVLRLMQVLGLIGQAKSCWQVDQFEITFLLPLLMQSSQKQHG